MHSSTVKVTSESAFSVENSDNPRVSFNREYPFSRVSANVSFMAFLTISSGVFLRIKYKPVTSAAITTTAATEIPIMRPFLLFFSMISYPPEISSP